MSPTTPTPPILRVEQLGCERDGRILFDDLAFEARAGEIWQVAGANGAGKTTLLRILAGLHGFHDGRVHWQVPGALHPRAHDQILFLGHLAGLRDELTAQENLRWLCALHHQPAALISSALAAVGLAGYDDAPVAAMSAGQQRRVALARLWLPGKAVWILDEPFTAIDAAGIELIEQRLRKQAAAGTLVIYTSHHRLAEDTRQIHLGGQRA